MWSKSDFGVHCITGNTVMSYTLRFARELYLKYMKWNSNKFIIYYAVSGMQRWSNFGFYQTAKHAVLLWCSQ